MKRKRKGREVTSTSLESARKRQNRGNGKLHDPELKGSRKETSVASCTHDHEASEATKGENVGKLQDLGEREVNEKLPGAFELL